MTLHQYMCIVANVGLSYPIALLFNVIVIYPQWRQQTPCLFTLTTHTGRLTFWRRPCLCSCTALWGSCEGCGPDSDIGSDGRTGRSTYTWRCTTTGLWSCQRKPCKIQKSSNIARSRDTWRCTTTGLWSCERRPREQRHNPDSDSNSFLFRSTFIFKFMS